MFQHVQSVFIIRIHGWIFWFEFLGHAEPALQPPKSVHHCSYFSLHEKYVFFSRMDSRTYLLFCRGRMNPGLDDGLVKELQLTHCWPRTHSTTSRLCFIFFLFWFLVFVYVFYCDSHAGKFHSSTTVTFLSSRPCSLIFLPR